MVDEDAEAFGRRVKLERARRWRTRKDFARDNDLEVRTLAAIENGERRNFTTETKAVIERALGWEIGDFDRVLNGGEPNRHYPPDLVRLMDMWAQLSAEARRMLVGMAEDALRRPEEH